MLARDVSGSVYRDVVDIFRYSVARVRYRLAVL